MLNYVRFYMLVLSIFLAASRPAPALATGTALTAAQVCAPYQVVGFAEQFRTCKSIVDRGLFKNLEALRYTIQFHADNCGRLRDPSCAIAGIKLDDRCESCRDPEWIKSGFDNRCSFVLNDLNEPWAADPQPGRTTAYYIDFCATQPNKQIRKIYLNGGTDPVGFDVPLNNSTLIGAFLGEGMVRGDFDTGRPESYVGIKRRNGGGIPVVRMIGLNSSNNDSEFDKPFHVTPFKTSHGCSATNEENVPLMHEIVARGSFLFMKWGGPKYQQRGMSCINE